MTIKFLLLIRERIVSYSLFKQMLAFIYSSDNFVQKINLCSNLLHKFSRGITQYCSTSWIRKKSGSSQEKYLIEWSTVVTGSSIAMSFGVSAAVGLIFGIYSLSVLSVYSVVKLLAKPILPHVFMLSPSYGQSYGNHQHKLYRSGRSPLPQVLPFPYCRYFAIGA
jgi:hypothetical protein